MSAKRARALVAVGVPSPQRCCWPPAARRRRRAPRGEHLDHGDPTRPPPRHPHHDSTTAVSTTTVTVPLETPTGGEFYSPTKNISCEIDDTTSLQQVFCQTMSPPQSVTMKVDGTLSEVRGTTVPGQSR